MTMHENLPILQCINFFTTVYYIYIMLLHESVYYMCVSDMYKFVHTFVNKVCICMCIIVITIMCSVCIGVSVRSTTILQLGLHNYVMHIQVMI